MYCCSWIQLLVLYLFILHDGIYLLVTVLEETPAVMVYCLFLVFYSCARTVALRCILHSELC